MRFVFPCKEFEEAAKDYIEEFYSYGSQINGCGGLDRYLKEASYQEWLEKVQSDIDLANVPGDRVPAYTYFYVDDNDRIIGMANIRLELNDFLLREGGHIGYSIRPTERRKGYGVDMLQEIITFCKRIGLNRILITCDKRNIASAGVAKKCGGRLENEFYSEIFQEVIQRYWIEA
jgi:predicted acetyltransferase